MSIPLEHLRQAIREGLQAILGDEMQALYLYGSQARGDARPDSDIDILIVLRSEFDYLATLERIAPVVCGLSLEHDVVISPTLITRQQMDSFRTPFILNIQREAVPL